MSKLNKTIITYIILSAAAFLFDKVYALFGHGVTSAWMSNMYLFLLASGAAVFTLLKLFAPNITGCKGYRLIYNLYNSGIAVFVNGMLLKGILEIAGGTSGLIRWFLYTGCGLIATAVIFLFMGMGRTTVES